MRDVPLHRQLREALARGELPPEHIRARVIAALDAAEFEHSLDTGFGLSPTWWTDDAVRRRNDRIDEGYRSFLAGKSSLRQAGIKIVRVASALLSGRVRVATPDTLEEFIQAAINTGAPFPRTGRQIENVLRCAKSERVPISNGDFAPDGRPLA